MSLIFLQESDFLDWLRSKKPKILIKAEDKIKYSPVHSILRQIEKDGDFDSFSKKVKDKTIKRFEDKTEAPHRIGFRKGVIDNNLQIRELIEEYLKEKQNEITDKEKIQLKRWIEESNKLENLMITMLKSNSNIEYKPSSSKNNEFNTDDDIDDDFDMDDDFDIDDD
jgi:hypothetical protein